MALDFLNLNEEVRLYMSREVDLDVANDAVFYSPRLTEIGRHRYPELLQEAVRQHDDTWLQQQLNSPGNIKSLEMSHRKGVPYQMKLLLQDFFEQPNRRAGGVFLNDWCTLARASGIGPLVKLAGTFQSHRRGILNWWRSQSSNGLIEGVNSLIQAAIAKARGYRNPQNLITIAYLIAGKLDFNADPARNPLPT